MKKTLVVALALSLAACGSPDRHRDAGAVDAFTPTWSDAGLDAGASETPDAPAPMDLDSAMAELDAAMGDAATSDAATSDAPITPPLDATMGDAAMPTEPCAQLAAVRARVGTFSTPLRVEGVMVSYVMPPLPTGATDPRGVFVQCTSDDGPALFLAISPDDRSTFPAPPTVGQLVSFQVHSARRSAETGNQHQVLSVSGWTEVEGTGAVVPQSVSMVPLLSVIDDYESELVSLSGTIASSAVAAGMGFTSFPITTYAVTTPTNNLRLRLPQELSDRLGLRVGCEVQLVGTPLWRFNDAAQPSAWDDSDLVVVSCPDTACPPATHLVINEIDYDNPGTDTAEFVELFNPTSAAIDLTGHALVQINGADSREYGRVALSGTIAAGGYLLVTAMGSSVPGATHSFPVALQNGAPDGVLLLGPGNVIIDAAIYEGTMTSATLAGGAVLSIAESGSIGADLNTGDVSLSRFPNGCDRDTPALDWQVRALTPGATNGEP